MYNLITAKYKAEMDEILAKRQKILEAIESKRIIEEEDPMWADYISDEEYELTRWSDESLQELLEDLDEEMNLLLDDLKIDLEAYTEPEE